MRLCGRPLSVRTCAFAACVIDYMYEYSRLRVSRFAIRIYSLPPPLSPPPPASSIRLRSVSMSYRQSNLYAGLFRETWRIEGGFHPLSSSTWPLLPSDPFFYVPASIAAKSQWLDRESIPRQHTSTAYLRLDRVGFAQTWPIVTFFFLSQRRLDRREIVSRYFFALISYLDLF